ncbi:hypothetical protein [Sulfobacillus sp. hq2]|uniref:hypothetical protein n=1 Tax=Sulfobacillus TaxID=28033 RepID=UPI000CD12B91|nr:hypothetical protein [Sulfobacillus sp. hq2]POB10423.1 hypothetical protein CO251_10805 [Sulfobacillus sp. hq2]
MQATVIGVIVLFVAILGASVWPAMRHHRGGWKSTGPGWPWIVRWGLTALILISIAWSVLRR